MALLDKQPYTLDSIIRKLVFLGIILGIIWMLDYLSVVLIPFGVALLIAYLLNPLVLFFQNRLRIKYRGVSIFLALGTVSGVLTAFGFFIVPLVLQEVRYMGRLIKRFINDTRLQERLNAYFPEDMNTYLSSLLTDREIQQFFEDGEVLSLITDGLKQVLPGIWGVFSSSMNALLGLFGLAIILLYVVFILIDYSRISSGWILYLPESYRPVVKTILEDLEEAMNNYFRAQALVAGTVGILFAIGFWIIGLPMGVALGLFIGLLNMVPYLQTLGLIPAAFLALMYSLENNESFFVIAGLVALVFVVVQSIQEAVLVPKIMGDATGLNPAIILLSLSIWGKLLGFLGLLIAIPMTYLLVAYYKRLLESGSIMEKEE